MFDSFRNMDDFLSLLGIEWAWQNIFGQPIGIDKNKKFVVTIFSLHLIMPQTWPVCGRYSGQFVGVRVGVFVGVRVGVLWALR